MGQEQQLIAALGARVGRLQLDMDHLLVRTQLAAINSVVSRSQRKVDACAGVYFEATTCTPLICSLEQTANTLGNHFLAKATKSKALQVGFRPNIALFCRDSDPTDAVQSDAESFQKSTYLEFENQTYELHVTATMRASIQADRVVYMWSSLTALPSKHWTFVEDIMVFVRRPNESSPMAHHDAQSLLQTWYRITVEQDDGATNALDWPLKEFIMQSLSNRVGDHLRRFKIDGRDQPHISK